jgi:hypothetical protein
MRGQVGSKKCHDRIGWRTGRLIALATLTFVASAAASTPNSAKEFTVAMTRERMESMIRDFVGSAQGDPGAIEFSYRGVPMACISDVRHDRMRIIARVARAESMSAEQIRRVLEANFHSALDARYGVSDGMLFAAYIHPISPLTEPQIASAIRQVAELAHSYGTTYSSGELDFGVLR